MQGNPAMRVLPQPLPAGVPTEARLVADYCAARRVPLPEPAQHSFFLALALFRVAAILAGVGARAAQGNASSRNAAQVGDHPPN